jgi:hypothetical protein
LQDQLRKALSALQRSLAYVDPHSQVKSDDRVVKRILREGAGETLWTRLGVSDSDGEARVERISNLIGDAFWRVQEAEEVLSEAHNIKTTIVRESLPLLKWFWCDVVSEQWETSEDTRTHEFCRTTIAHQAQTFWAMDPKQAVAGLGEVLRGR